MSQLKSKAKRAKSLKSVGQAPGTITYIGNKDKVSTAVEIYNFSKTKYQKIETEDVKDAFKFRDQDQTTWVNVDGLNNTQAIADIGEHYGLHPLTMEDIANTNQRPKIDEYPNYLQIVLKMLYFNSEGEFIIEHITLILGENFVISFQESEEDVFSTIRNRLEDSNSRIRASQGDYLAYVIMDAIIDNYFLVIDDLGDRVESLEEKLFINSQEDKITLDIQALKRKILRFRKAIGPLRDVISKLSKSDSILIKEKTTDYFRDLYDHILYVNENVELYREMIWSLMDMYMTTISNKMNEVMKVLTIIATIFIPLTFIAGIYGMNFENMPELGYRNGYYILWGVMIMVLIAMIIFFKRKKWL